MGRPKSPVKTLYSREYYWMKAKFESGDYDSGYFWSVVDKDIWKEWSKDKTKHKELMQLLWVGLQMEGDPKVFERQLLEK